jgi:hypothetical protein
MTNTEEEATQACAHCDSQFDRDGCYYLEDVGDVCHDCYYKAVNTCQLCGNTDVLDKDLSNYILVKDELAGTADGLPGIYKILSRPFLSIPTVGGGSLYYNDVLFVDCLPRPDETFEISGHICKQCAWPYSRTYGAVYGQIRERRLRGYRRTHRLRAAEKRRVTEVFTRNPKRLRDLEACEWEIENLRERWLLPRVPFYHERLFLEHAGVKVYRCYDFDSDWLTLRPEPDYRHSGGTTRNVVFAPSGLPTFDMEACMKLNPYYDKQQQAELDRAAVRQAIDQGIITQTAIHPYEK